ncbi:MAG: DUF4846 domain-containing protein, partial [Bacteroidota bacterium]
LPSAHQIFVIIYYFFIYCFFILCGCNSDSSDSSVTDGSSNLIENSLTISNNLPQELNTNPDGSEIKSRIQPPDGFNWVEEEEGSMGQFLQNLKLKPSGSQILDYTGTPIDNQSEHAAVLDIDVGDKNLQQCADAVIRLRAEYLWHHNRQSEIAFHFTSGDLCRWEDYRDGVRPSITGNNVRFSKTATLDRSYANFRKYLNLVFTYAGTISLDKETRRLGTDETLEPGDILITPGSPGHVVIIVGHAQNANGKNIYLLAESYMPAQSIHIVTNPYNSSISPWYELKPTTDPVTTARYSFATGNFRRFK